MATFSITYVRVARTGPFDIALEADEDTSVADAAVATLREYGCTEPSNSWGDGSRVTSYYQVGPEPYSRTGEETSRFIHFEGLTDDELRTIHDRITGRR